MFLESLKDNKSSAYRPTRRKTVSLCPEVLIPALKRSACTFGNCFFGRPHKGAL
jgi:hypothetical protein